jgi:hypothetical protein
LGNKDIPPAIAAALKNLRRFINTDFGVISDGLISEFFRDLINISNRSLLLLLGLVITVIVIL